MNFFDELKRRNVVRVGIAYAVGAWLLAQVADLVLDVIGAPDIILRSLAILLVLGFVPVLIFAWVFELTPEGIRKETEIDRSQSITRHTARKLDYVTIALVIAAVGFVIVERYLPEQASPETGRAQARSYAEDTVGGRLRPNETDDSVGGRLRPNEAIDSRAERAPTTPKSIAVLPFANRSNQDDDLFFTDGIHDDLLTQLAKIHDLTVISRTSVMEYRDTPKNLKEIGAELGVSTILEGGVQKVGNRVRINTQLIEVATDKHLWAESFDRELTAENIFDIQSEIARKIVHAVEIQLTPEEEHNLSEVPTQNLAAYEAYLQAQRIMSAANYSRAQEIEAQAWLEKAVALDPKFAEAHAMLADNLGQVYWRGVDTSEAFLEKYRKSIDTALALNPRSPSALRAAANYHYRVENDYQKSLSLVDQALKGAPGDVELRVARALSLRRLGRWDESIDSFQRTLELDPNNRNTLALMVETMESVNRWQDILDNTVSLQDADPDDLDIQITRANAQFNLTGDLQPLEDVFKRMNLEATSDYISSSTRALWYQRDPDGTIEVLNSPLWTENEVTKAFQSIREYELANAYRFKGEQERANALYEQIIAKQDDVMSSALQVQCYAGMNIALSMARLGRFDEALALADKLTSEITYERDALLYGWLRTQQAMIMGLAGDQEAALDNLETALQIPTAFRVTTWDLYYDPNWDFMRDNPRFVELATPAVTIRSEGS